MDLDNLRSITGRTPEENQADSATMARLFRTLYEFPKVTIAAVNGPAIAGGCGAGDAVRFHLGLQRSQVRLYRGAHRIRSSDCFDVLAAPDRRKAGARFVADRADHRRGGGVSPGAGQRSSGSRESSGSCARAGGQPVAEQPRIVAGDQAIAEEIPRTTCRGRSRLRWKRMRASAPPPIFAKA